MAYFTSEEISAMEFINKTFEQVDAIHVHTNEVHTPGGPQYTFVELYIQFPDKVDITPELRKQVAGLFVSNPNETVSYCAYIYEGYILDDEYGEVKVWKKN